MCACVCVCVFLCVCILSVGARMLHHSDSFDRCECVDAQRARGRERMITFYLFGCVPEH